jgi:glycosyltransferase involved in cell wall biosynthesis
MDQVVAISDDVARYTHDTLGVPEKRILTIPNGIDFTHIPSRGGHAFPETPRLLMVGRLVPQKGHAVVLHALQHVSLPWKLHIVGDGPLRRELKELSEKLGLASRVRFLGERKDVPALLKESDLFLFPSQWEGMGLALVEALAAGVPAIASDLPALREFMPKKQLIDADDPHAWRAAITDLLTSAGNRIETAASLAQKVRTRYDAERMIAAYAEMYRTLLNA